MLSRFQPGNRLLDRDASSRESFHGGPALVASAVTNPATFAGVIVTTGSSESCLSRIIRGKCNHAKTSLGRPQRRQLLTRRHNRIKLTGPPGILPPAGAPLRTRSGARDR